MSRTRKREGISGRRLRQEKRRLEAAELFAQGKNQTEVAREMGVSRRAVHDWHKAWKAAGAAGLVSQKKPGPAPKFTDSDAAWLAGELQRGPLAHGYSNALWTVPRVRR
ncbi:transposase, partial [Verrucomicrobia bacterium LW23]